MAKIVAKLPYDDQKKIDEYLTSDGICDDSSPDLDKFWTWLEHLHKSAVQGSLRSLCTKVSHGGMGSGSGTKFGMTCNSCGGLGHFARNCPTKVRQAAGRPSAKINIAVAKITTRYEYKKHLTETQKQVGNCTSCGQPAHFYARKFPFGTGDWPSTRLDSCPQFLRKVQGKELSSSNT